MISAEEAWQRIESRLRPTTRTEELARLDALHRVLARDVAATVDEPMADVSAMDGYAVGGTPEEGAELAVVGVSAAGRPPDFEVGEGQAAKIMTGAVVPPGADRVIPVEQTTSVTGGVDAVRIDSVVEDRRHIRKKGEVIARGEALLPAGRRLVPGALSTLASHGVMRVPVLAAPRVAVLSTGDEVVPPEVTPGPGQLRDSNGPFLLAAGRSMGVEFRHLGIAGDARDELEAAIHDGAAGSDVLLVCGGVSMGDYDFVEDVLRELGCETLFDEVAIQPGKPLVAARRPPIEGDAGEDAGGWIFGLPGNPASVMVTFWLFVRPLIRRWMGHEDGFWHGALEAELAGELPRSKGRDRFVAAELAVADGRLRATPLHAVGSHDAGTYGRGTGLVRIRPNREARPAGGVCQVLPVGVGSMV